jgi:hypothetical protein
MPADNPTPAPTADPDPGDTHAAAHERAEQLGDQVVGHGDAIAELRDKVDDLEALMHGTVQLILEDDEEAGPEKTTVVPRQEPPPAGEKPPGEPPAEKSTKHSGLFR